MNSIKFDVIMPCYNSEEYVKQAVESLLNQTYLNWELVAVNDGSTDNTLKILEEYAIKDKRIKVYSKKNGGYSTAINYGLDKVSGDYFLMLGSDDRLASDLLGKIAESARKKEPDIIAFRAIRYKNGFEPKLDTITDFDTEESEFNTTIAKYESNYPKNAKILFVRDTAKCFKTSLLENQRYFGKYGFDADGVFSTLFTHKCHSFLSLPLDGYLWTIRDDSVSATVDKKVHIDRLKVWNRYLSAVDKDKKLLLTNKEHKYVLYPFVVSIDLLKQYSCISFIDILYMHRAVRHSIKTAKKRNISLSDYAEILVDNPLKRSLFLLFPIIWLVRHGFVKN